MRFDANRVGNLRRHWNIPCFVPSKESPDGELLSIKQAAFKLNIAPSTLHRWLNDGFIAGEQVTPGAPWQIRLTDKIEQLFVDETPAHYATMQEATRRLGVTRQTVLQRVKRGELEVIHVRRGRQKGIKIKLVDDHPDLFNSTP